MDKLWSQKRSMNTERLRLELRSDAQERIEMSRERMTRRQRRVATSTSLVGRRVS